MTGKKRTRLSPHARRMQLLDCAGEIIQEHGLSNFTMESLAKHANVSNPLIYKYFDARLGILQELLQREFESYSKNFFAGIAAADTYEEIVTFVVTLNFEDARKGNILSILRNQPDIKTVIEKGEAKALELGYGGSSRNRVVDSYKFSALNFATNYRVFTYDNPWGSTKASYFHKNLGGYHGAKLRNIQNLFEFQLANGNNKMFDILNVKYFLQGPSARQNRTAMGNVWFVKTIKEKDG